MLLGLGYQAQVGKDTIAQILSKYGWERVAFADALKELALAIDPMVTCEVRGGNLRRTCRLSEAVAVKGWEGAKALPEVRRFLQNLGTGVREHIDPHAWVDIAMRRINWLDPRHVVITDVRFPNEVETIKANGGVVWKVTRPGYGPVNSHVSELALDDFDGWDAEIVNDGTIEDLERKVLGVLQAKVPVA